MNPISGLNCLFYLLIFGLVQGLEKNVNLVTLEVANNKIATLSGRRVFTLASVQCVMGKQGCGSGPFSAGSRILLAIKESIQTSKFFSHQTYFF